MKNTRKLKGKYVVEPDTANLPAPGGGPDPAYERITQGPRYSWTWSMHHVSYSACPESRYS